MSFLHFDYFVWLDIFARRGTVKGRGEALLTIKRKSLTIVLVMCIVDCPYEVKSSNIRVGLVDYVNVRTMQLKLLKLSNVKSSEQVFNKLCKINTQN